ncbi:MAG: hemerythrin domain-containing protein [Lautropia sp.]
MPDHETPPCQVAPGAPQPATPAADAPGFVVGWTDALALDDADMDRTHREFADLLAAILDAPDARVPALLDETVEHTRAHFLQETTWMQMTAFPPIHCHEREHSNIMEVVLEVQRRVARGEIDLARTLATALAEWLQLHVDTMDRVLSLWMKEQRRLQAAA